MRRSGTNLGIWPHRGKVAAVGVGYSPTARRWDEKAETSLGAMSIVAARAAIEDAGVSPDQIDGVITSPNGLGEPWAPRDIPEDFARAYKPSDNKEDGLSRISADWLVPNMSELTNVNFTMHGDGCMSKALTVAAEAVGSGQCHTCLVVAGRGNLAGRYGQSGAQALNTVGGAQQWSNVWGPTGPYWVAWIFNNYLKKYGVTHDMMAPFVVNEKRNGLLNPHGFFYQNRPEPLTVEDYISARWIVKPANLYDCDIPIQVGIAYIFTTPERAKDMKQKPVYVLNHVATNPRPRSLQNTLEEYETASDIWADKMLDGSGIKASDIDVENMYEGYIIFHQYYLEAIQWQGIKKGDSLHFYQGDISVEGPHPVSPSGGNAGSGRTRTWMHSDSIEQLQGRAGSRQVHIKNGRPEIAISGGPQPIGGDHLVWSTSPD